MGMGPRGSVSSLVSPALEVFLNMLTRRCMKPRDTAADISPSSSAVSRLSLHFLSSWLLKAARKRLSIPRKKRKNNVNVYAAAVVVVQSVKNNVTRVFTENVEDMPDMDDMDGMVWSDAMVECAAAAAAVPLGISMFISMLIAMMQKPVMATC
jgi:hypothetical protein